MKYVILFNVNGHSRYEVASIEFPNPRNIEWQLKKRCENIYYRYFDRECDMPVISVSVNEQDYSALTVYVQKSETFTCLVFPETKVSAIEKDLYSATVFAKIRDAKEYIERWNSLAEKYNFNLRERVSHTLYNKLADLESVTSLCLSLYKNNV